MDHLIGKMLDNRYEILEVVGTGGMAVVYKARCHRLNRLVAIKILREDLAQDEEFRRRFHDESQAVAMLSHPNIMAVYDVSKSSDLEYIVMELLDGITLKQYMQKKGSPLNWKEALHFITQICKALSHAHSRGIIHRDIKPQNIMVLRDGSVKVADFGIARLTSANQSTLTKEALGSVHYISPEQARGSHIDCRSDIYSAGVVLYEMLTGRLPFEGDTPVSVAIQHINSIPLSPRELNPEIPEALEAITMKAMAHNPDQRYESADAMLADLEEFRKNPNINFDYTPADLFPTGTGEPDEPTQIRQAAGEEAIQHRHRRDWEDNSEEDEEEAMDRRRRRGREGGGMSIPIALAAILVFVVGIVIFLWVTFLKDFFPGENATGPIRVPNLLGLTVEEAQENEEVKEGNFTIVEGEPITTADVAVGCIAEQTPEANRQIQSDTPTITVRVSAGANTFAMPNVVNREWRTAKLELDRMKLVVKNYEWEPSDITANYVTRTDPMPGLPVVEGQEVTLYVSQGPEVVPVTMLTLEGTPLNEAKRMLTDMKLTLGGTTYVDSELPKDTVVRQSVAAGTTINEGSSVSLEVSKGPENSNLEPSPSPSGEVDPSAAPSDEPTTSPDVTPIPPSAAPTSATRTLRIELPQDGRETVLVQVMVDGAIQYENTVQASVLPFTNANITGSGKKTASVYFDGVFQYSQEVDFSS